MIERWTTWERCLQVARVLFKYLRAMLKMFLGIAFSTVDQSNRL